MDIHPGVVVVSDDDRPAQLWREPPVEAKRSAPRVVMVGR
jgi:hypothetical protein